MKRTIVLLVALLLASALPASPQATDNATLLLQRVTNQYGPGKGQVFIGKLPTDMPNVPLPGVSVLGSIHRKTQGENPSESYELYYNATPETMRAYRAALAATGWTKSQTPMMSTGGFVSSNGPSSSNYCKADASMIGIWIGEDPNDVTLTILPRSKGVDVLCGGPEAMVRMMTSVMPSALPKLHAPPGVSMRLGRPGIQTGQSGAYISGASSAQNLLDNFSAQMRAAGWQPGATSTGTALASQTFHFVDTAKAPWQCVITVYAVDGKPGDYIGFIDATNLSTLENNGFHSVIRKSP